MTDGIINVYKESGFTSHDVVAKLRGILRQKKIGHTGTLDPEAQGVLPVCLGKATRVCELLAGHDKQYRAVLLLGVVTDTQDMAGRVLQETPVNCGEEEVRRCIAAFTGPQQQVPPMYSALKVNGQKLYDLARQGIEVERRPRPVVIEEIRIEEIRLPEVTMTVTCSKGTYIRTLCHDIGAALGCGGCMKSLLRTRVGPFAVEDSVTLDEIVRLRDEGRLQELIRPVDSLFAQVPRVTLDGAAERLVRNGNPLPRREIAGRLARNGDLQARQETTGRLPQNGGTQVRQESAGQPLQDGGTQVRQETAGQLLQDGGTLPDSADGRIRVYGADGQFLAIYGWNEQKQSYRAVKMFL